MVQRFNGRFLPPGHDKPSDEPSSDFPIHEAVHDHSGNERQFTIVLHEVGLGYLLVAREDKETEDEPGYEFTAFDPSSPYLALGALRSKMYRALAVRHLIARPGGELIMLHDRISGHIGYSKGRKEIAFVVDGMALTLEDIGRFATTHEGWQFTLRFVDRSGETE